MATKWIVCGPGRGVGKTRLAQNLCHILPNALYAKLGHCPQNPEKPSNYFQTEEELVAFVTDRDGKYEHLVLETGTLAHSGTGDIVVYLDGLPQGNNVPEDASELRGLADITVGPDASVRQWKSVLRRKIGERPLCEGVCDALVEQQLFLRSTYLRVKSKIWFDAAGMRVVGSGLARLLECVSLYGTLSDAARASRMSYRYAWELIKNAEKHLGGKLLLPQVGGSCGGGSALSDKGRRLLEVYQRVNDEVETYANERFDFYYRRRERPERTHEEIRNDIREGTE